MTIITILFTIFSYITEGKLIQFVTSRYIQDFTWKQGTSIAFINSFYRFLTLGAAAGPAEVYYIHREGIPLSGATGMCLSKYIIHRITIAVLGVISYLGLSAGMRSILEPYRIYIILGSLITAVYTIVLITACTSRKFAELIINLLMKMPNKKIRLCRKISNLIDGINLLQEESTYLLSNRRKVLWIFLLNMEKQSFYYLIPAILLYHRSTIPVIDTAALMAICNMLAAVLPAPSGIGSLDFVFLKLFKTITKTGIAGSVILLYRFDTWMIPFVVGGMYLMLGYTAKRQLPE